MLYLPSVMLGRRKRGSVVDLPPETPQPVPMDLTTFTTVTGDGTASANTSTGVVSVTYGTVATSLRGSTPVTSSKRYRVQWTMANDNGNAGQVGFGTSLGGPQYRPTLSGTVGTNTFDFTAVSTPLYVTFQKPSAGTSTFSSITLLEIPEVTWVDTSLITPAGWTQLSSGVTVDGSTGAITIPATGTALSARQGVATEVGKFYRLRWTNGSNTTQCLIGPTNGSGVQKTASSSDPVGSRTYEFTATSTTTWIQFQRSANGTAVVSNIQIQEVAP